MRIYGLYIGTKYEDCRWNNIWDMANCLVFYHFWQNLALTFTFGQGHRHLGHWMRLIRLYIGTKYEVCRWNSFRAITSSLVFYLFLGKFDLNLWPWPWVIECALLGCTLVPSMKSVVEIASEIWPCSSLIFYPFWGKYDLDLWPGNRFIVNTYEGIFGHLKSNKLSNLHSLY